MVPPQAQAAPPPQLIQAQAELADKQKATDAKTTEAQAKMIQAQGFAAKAHAEAQTAGLDGGQGAPAPGPEPISPFDIAKAEAMTLDAKTRAKEVGLKERQMVVEDQNRDQDRHAKELDTRVDLAKDLLTAPPGAQNVGAKANRIVKEVKKSP